ncbi:AraC family transcriptional regulator [Streptomyces mashuensis]|uniref:AraC family transcriptional regulator n=1 Tax=Streptomyces mashuensis TaxID=33904 RepID=UPI00167D72EF|nr:AraC family transcriptional regulator [Streptomyces mashuensis]
MLHAHFRRHRYPRHTHDAVTVALVDSGAASFLYRGETHTAAAGDVFVIDAGEVHTGVLAHPQGYRYRVLYLAPGTLERLQDDDSAGDRARRRASGYRETVIRDTRLAALLGRVHDALRPPGNPMLQEVLLARFARALAEGYGYGPVDAVRPEPPRAGHRAVAMARAYLEDRLADKVSLHDLAAQTCVSPYRLARLFNAEVGMPPHTFQNLLRVQRARQLLAGGARAAGIAREVGFYDQAHLNRVFKRYTGVTPHQFRVGTRGPR